MLHPSHGVSFIARALDSDAGAVALPPALLAIAHARTSLRRRGERPATCSRTRLICIADLLVAALVSVLCVHR
jgi:hypothetical protein